jgi:carbon-monoxide dehydrogenase medium subunit
LRDRLPEFGYHAPTSLEEAASMLSKLSGAVVLQGGTDLMVSIKQKGLRPSHIVSLRNLRGELGKIKESHGGVRIGAAVTFHDLERSAVIRERFTALHEAVEQIASYQIRNTATIGGNLCNASPAADSAPPLMVFDAKLIVRGMGGKREVPIESFFKGPGKTALNRSDVLTEILIPTPAAESGASFHKLGRRISEDISVASAAACLTMKGGVTSVARIALGSVAPTPMRAHKAEKALVGKRLTNETILEAACAAKEECSPITDLRAGADYRRAMVEVLTRRAIETAFARSRSGAN